MKRPRRFNPALVVLLLLLAAATAWGQEVDMRRPKKLIATGWDRPDTRALRENLAEMERQPFDGVVLVAVGRNDEGKACSMRAAFHNRPWKRQWFQSCIDDLKACQFKRFTDNFITIGANPGNVDWFDDEGWKVIVEHWRTAAWVAKQSGVKGLLFDPEPYSRPFSQFDHVAQSQTGRHTFDEYYAKARQRGQEVMRAVAEEYPDITIFCYFLNSVTSTATGHADPRGALASRRSYGLLPPFVDGWLDVVPPGVTLVDGCESAYLFNSRRQYVEAALKIKGDCQELVSPANRAKYRAQVQVSFGVYLDAYWNPKDSKWGRWYIDGLGGPRVERLRDNVTTALRAADEYVWIYGEKYRWWPTANGRVNAESWPQALPGCDDVLRFARDPLGFARLQMARLEKAGKLVNLARNGSFDAEVTTTIEGREAKYRESSTPAGWSCWQTDESKGSFTWDRQIGDGAAKATGVASGCFIQSVEARSGQRFVVRAKRRLQGSGSASIRVRWQTPEGKWIHETLDKMILSRGPTGKWAELFGVVEVPDGVGRLVVLLGISGQTTPESAGWYDDVEIYRLP